MKKLIKTAGKIFKNRVFFCFLLWVFAAKSVCYANIDYITGVVFETKDLNKRNLVGKYNFTAQISGEKYNIETTDQQGQKIAQIGFFSDQECVAVSFSNPAVLNGSNVYSAAITADSYPLGVHDSAQVVWLALIMSGKWIENSTLNGHYPLVLSTQLMERKLPFAEAEVINAKMVPTGLMKQFTLNLPPVLYLEEMELKSLGVSDFDISKLARTHDNRIRVPLSDIKDSYPFLRYESEWDEDKKFPRSGRLTRLSKPDGLGGTEKPMANWEIKIILDKSSDSTVPEVSVPALVMVHDHRLLDKVGNPKAYLLHHEPWPRRDSTYYHRLRGQVSAERKGASNLSTGWAIAIISCLAVVPVIIATIRMFFNKGDSRPSS
jgi:hypothetical protein